MKRNLAIGAQQKNSSSGKRRQWLRGAGLLGLLLISLAAQAQPLQKPTFNPIIKPLPKFVYLCYEHIGPYTEFYDVARRFLDEFRRSRIPQVGHEIAVFWNNPALVSPSELRYDIGFPVKVAPKIIGNMKLKLFNYTKVISVVHTGPYTTTYQTTDLLYRYIAVRGLKLLGGPRVEIYLDDNPAMVPDHKKQTEILIPID